MTWPRRVVMTLIALSLAASAGSIAVSIVAPSQDTIAVAVETLIGWASLVLAGFVSQRRPANPVGCLLALLGLVPTLAGLNDAYDYGALRHPGVLGDPSAILQAQQGVWVLLYLPVALLMLYFPDGRAAGRGWSRVAVILTAASVLYLFFEGAAGTPYNPPFQHFGHPLGTLPGAEILDQVFVAGFMGLLIVCAIGMVVRYRRSARVERAQLKWLALGAAGLPGTLLLCWVGYLVQGTPDRLVAPGLVVLYLGVPASITIALLNHELYDVDSAVSATVRYGLVIAVLLAAYSLASFTAGAVLGRDTAITGAAAATLCAAALVPLKNWARRLVDKRFYPLRLAAAAAVDRLRAEVHAGRARPEQLQEVLAATLRDPHLRVGYRLPRGEGFVDASGQPVSANGAAVTVGGIMIGVLASGPDVSPGLLYEAAAASAMLVELGRLRADLGVALREAESSRSRLVQVGYEERRKLERDLHDGAQQRLVTLGMTLRLAQRHLGDDAVSAAQVIDQAVAELGTAVAELREIAHGLRPGLLDNGLGPALEALAEALPVPVDVVTDLDGVAVTDATTTTAYYVAREAVANVMKHADATCITIWAATADGRLRISVTDDGCGGAEPLAGSGLAGLADRVTALGGALTVCSPPGAGTVIEAVLPCTL